MCLLRVLLSRPSFPWFSHPVVWGERLSFVMRPCVLVCSLSLCALVLLSPPAL